MPISVCSFYCIFYFDFSNFFFNFFYIFIFLFSFLEGAGWGLTISSIVQNSYISQAEMLEHISDGKGVCTYVSEEPDVVW